MSSTSGLFSGSSSASSGSTARAQHSSAVVSGRFANVIHVRTFFASLEWLVRWPSILSSASLYASLSAAAPFESVVRVDLTSFAVVLSDRESMCRRARRNLEYVSAYRCKDEKRLTCRRQPRLLFPAPISAGLRCAGHIRAAGVFGQLRTA